MHSCSVGTQLCLVYIGTYSVVDTPTGVYVCIQDINCYCSGGGDPFLSLSHHTLYLGPWGGGVHDAASVRPSVDDHTHCTA